MEFNKPAPLKMTGNLPQNFKFFKQQIEIYITATETDTKSKGVQVARLLNLMGADALKVYNTLITDKDKDTEVSGILEKLEKYCSPRVNEIMAHYKFFTAKQNEDPFDVYLTHLKELVKPCNFGTMETKLLKTQIVLGVQSRDTLERLLREDMTIEKVIAFCQSVEAAEKNCKELEKTTEVNQINRTKTTINNCTRCGTTHSINRCPAYEFNKMSDKTLDEAAVEDTVCGVWFFKPKWLQIFASKKVYVLVYGLLGLNQFMLSSYFNGTLTTMEKRFKFSSQMSGIISSTWDLFSLISFMVTSHMAGRGHRTRWLAIGSFFVGLSCFVRLLPHVIYGPGEDILQYTVEYGNNVNSTSLLSNISRQNEKICDGQPLYEDCDNKQFWNVAAFILCAAHAMLGLGGSLYWTCGAAYLDDNVRKNAVPLLLAIVQCIRMSGPMMGYMLSAYTLTYFIEPNLTPTITNEDPRWIGAWWMGWTPIGITCIVFSIVMMFFPRMLPRAAARMAKEPKEKVEKISTDFKTSLKRILSNKILVFNSASNSFFVLGLIGYWTFMPKYMETQFRQTAANSNFASGAIGILSSGLGIVTSGIVISKFKPSARSLAMWNFITEALEVVGHFVYIFLGCASEDLHGQWNADKTWNLTMDCNVGCNCGKSMSYNPVCSFDRSTTFYSPCYAGCTLETVIDGGIKAYSNCTCIGGAGTATEGVCPVDCGYDFIIFLALMGVMRFFSSTGRSGNTIIQFRCVKQEDKSLSLGFSEVVMALVAFMPGPILYGTIVDATCMVWGGKCGTNGNCWLYDGMRLKYYLNFTGASFLLIGTILDIGVWYHVKDLKIYDASDGDEKPARE